MLDASGAAKLQNNYKNFSVAIFFVDKLWSFILSVAAYFSYLRRQYRFSSYVYTYVRLKGKQVRILYSPAAVYLYYIAQYHICH